MKLTRTAAACAALLFAAGCGGSESTGAPKAASSTPATPAGAAAATSPEELVHQVALTRADLPDGFSQDHAQRGDAVEGQVTLDLCGADFSSENLRAARHQVAFPFGSGSSFVGNEVVAYRSGGAEKALSELHSAVDQCPAGYVTSGVQGVPELRTVITPVPNQATWQPDSYAFRLRATPRRGPTHDITLVFQPQGNVVSMLYLSGAEPLKLLDQLTALLSKRLSDAGSSTTS